MYTATETQIAARITAIVPAGTWYSLTDLRPHLAAWSRADQDATLRKMGRCTDVNIIPETNQKAMSDADPAAAVIIGEQRKHLIRIDA